MTTPRRRREWQDFFIDEVINVGEIDQEQLVRQEGLDAKGMTLVRMIIGLNVISDGIVNDSVDIVEINLGVGLVSFDILETSLEINVGNQNDVPMSGWLWRKRVLVGEIWQSQNRIDEDLRSQRKLMYGQPRIFVSSSLNSGTAFAVEVTGLIRCLYLLP